MLCTSTLPIRTATTLGARFQPAAFFPTTAATYSTTAAPSRTRSIKVPICSSIAKRPSTCSKQTMSRQAPFKVTLRYDSTVSSAATSTAPSPISPQHEPLTWNAFLALRKTRRRYQLVSSIVFALGSTVTGIGILSGLDIDAIGAQLSGLDPFVVMGLATIASAGAGWLAGPLFGGAVFRLVHRQRVAEMGVKEKAFYERIKKYRVDPSSSSYGNPVPDYYGEKIGSVQDYRRWLKDQRAFNRKKSKNLV